MKRLAPLMYCTAYFKDEVPVLDVCWAVFRVNLIILYRWVKLQVSVKFLSQNLF